MLTSYTQLSLLHLTYHKPHIPQDLSSTCPLQWYLPYLCRLSTKVATTRVRQPCRPFRNNSLGGMEFGTCGWLYGSTLVRAILPGEHINQQSNVLIVTELVSLCWPWANKSNGMPYNCRVYCLPFALTTSLEAGCFWAERGNGPVSAMSDNSAKPRNYHCILIACRLTSAWSGWEPCT